MGRVMCYEIGFKLLCLLVAVHSGSTQNCGKRKVVETLIVNGNEAKEGYWPWHAIIFHNSVGISAYKCGGTILDRNAVLTAAHCVMTSNGPIARRRVSVQVGRNRLTVFNKRAEEHEVDELIIHPDFNVNSIEHDIALVRLATDITYTTYIQPICLWNRGEDQSAIVGTRGTVIGFGIDGSENISETLREAKIPVVRHITCIESNRQVFGLHLTSNMFCAGDRDRVSACNGDSGGGLFFNYDNTWYIRGVVSFTQPRPDSVICDPKEYTVFTDVAKYLRWIEQHVRGVSGQQTMPGVDDNRKIELLPMSIKNATEVSTILDDIPTYYPEDSSEEHMSESGRQPIGTQKDNSHKISLLPMSTCGLIPKSDFPIFPWMGVLGCSADYRNVGNQMCFASLITDLYLVTAVSCEPVNNYGNRCNPTFIHLGVHADSFGRMYSPPIQTIPIESMIVHTDYSGKNLANDIALIRLLYRPKNVNPICLPVTSELNSFKSDNFFSPYLEAVFESEKSAVNCIEWIGSPLQLSKPEMMTRHICIKSKCVRSEPEPPLQIRQNVQGEERYVLHGVFSIYRDCEAFVYTNVSSYIGWILENIRE